MKATRGRPPKGGKALRTTKTCAKRSPSVRRFYGNRFGDAMRLGIAFLITRFICFLLFVRPFSARALRFRCFGNQKLLSDLQFSWVVNVIERNQIVVRDFQFLRDSNWTIALLHNVSLS